jgi:hypothetical protein
MIPHVAAPTMAAVSLLMTPVQPDRKNPNALRAKYLLVCISTPLNGLRISAKLVQAQYLCQEKKWEKVCQFLLVSAL